MRAVFCTAQEEKDRGNGGDNEEEKGGERRRGYPLHKLYLTAPAGARLLAHAFTCALRVSYALLYKMQRALVSNVRFIRQDKGVRTRVRCGRTSRLRSR